VNRPPDLGRLRLGVEPLETQLARVRRVTWVLCGVVAALSLFFLTLFTAFGRPDVGAAVVAVLFGPIVGFAWFDDVTLHRNARSYLRASRRQDDGPNVAADHSVTE